MNMTSVACRPRPGCAHWVRSPAVLQQPDAVVLPVRAEHAGRAVALLPAAVGHGFGRGAAGQPAAILRDTHGENLIFVRAVLLTQCAQPGRGRHAADVMFPVQKFSKNNLANARIICYDNKLKTCSVPKGHGHIEQRESF